MGAVADIEDSLYSARSRIEDAQMALAGISAQKPAATIVSDWLNRKKLLGMVPRDVELVERLIEDIR